MTPWEQAVVSVVLRLEPGDVVSYGEVAAEAGRPAAARSVGAVLAASNGTLPWWRVVTSTGRLVPGLEDEQRRRLLAEGVEVIGSRVVDAAGRARRVAEGRG